MKLDKSLADHIAGLIVERLFVNGAGERAASLRLVSSDGRDLGGWSQKPMQDHIGSFLAELTLPGKDYGRTTQD